MVFATPQPLKIPRLREGLTVQAISQTEYVIKRHDSREYFSVGAAEAWFSWNRDYRRPGQPRMLCRSLESPTVSQKSPAALRIWNWKKIA